MKQSLHIAGQAIDAKRKLQDGVLDLERDDVRRFEPIIRFVNGSKQLKYVAKRRDLQELRNTLQKVGSNLRLNARRLEWEPREAWKLVVDQGSFAHVNAAPGFAGAASCGETRLTATKWSDGESNPDLLNAIQPSDSTKQGVQATSPPLNVCKTSANRNEVQAVIELWDTLPESIRQAVLAMIRSTKGE